ncbi:hypothetical protein MRX96_045765 [Rhipicephalus microplus]
MMEFTAASLSSSLGKGRYVVTVHVSGDERTRLGDPWTHYYPTNVIVESPDKSDPDDFKDRVAARLLQACGLAQRSEKPDKQAHRCLSEGGLQPWIFEPARTKTKIDKEFEKQERMTGSRHCRSGSLSWTIFLAARIANSYGLKSDKSHVRWVVDWTPPATTTSTVATATTVATTTEGNNSNAANRNGRNPPDGLWQLWVWFLIGGIAVVIMIAAVLVMLFRLRAGNDSLFTQRQAHQHSSDRVTYSQIT